MLKFVAWMPNNSIPEFECKDSQINRYYKEQLQDTIRICNSCWYVKEDFEILYHSSW